VKKRVADIINTPYAEEWSGHRISCESSPEEIERAVRDNDLEQRGYQSHEAELNKEWNQPGTFEGYCELEHVYHVRRVAFFVKNSWTYSITLNSDGRTVSDGLHRLKSAIYLNMEYVEVN
jgi:hypothetical protein